MAESVGGGHVNGDEGNAVYRFLCELVNSPLNLALLGVCAFLIYKIYRARHDEPPKPKEPEIPPMKKRDFTLSQLKEFDGRGDGRILIAVNGKVFDVTRGKKFYGPGMAIQ
jgi:membrane-associated progesterone receptor component